MQRNNKVLYQFFLILSPVCSRNGYKGQILSLIQFNGGKIGKFYQYLLNLSKLQIIFE